MRESKFTIRNTPNRAKPWCIEVSAPNSGTGKRQRLFFRTKEEALVKQNELRAHRRQHGETYRSLPPDVVADATRALKLLKKWPGATLLEAVRLFDEQKQIASQSDTISEVLNAYLIEKETARSARYVGQIDQVRKRLSARAGEVPVGSLDAGSLNEILEEASPWTQNSNARILKAALSHAFARDRIPFDLSKKIHLVETKKSDTAILTPDEASRLMKACTALSAPVFAIRLFAGVRSEETTRLPVEDIDVDSAEIYIRDHVSKVRGHDRVIPMEPNLVAWLKAFPPGETLIPFGWDQMWNQVRQSAGLKDGWSQNVLRHSFATYWLAKHESLDGLAARMGHFGGLQMLRRHYFRAVSKVDAGKFWAILPGPKNQSESTL